MVVRALVINESNLDVAHISSELRENYCSLLFARSMEDSLRIVGTQSIDIVFITIPMDFSPKTSKLFLDFFSILRQLCTVIPIIGLINSEDQCIPVVDWEDIICTNVDKKTLMMRIDILSKIKNMFNESLLDNMYLDEMGPKKIVTFFHDNADFLHKNISEDIEIVVFRTWPVMDNACASDMFLINVDHTQAYECCASLRLRTANKNKPIVLSYDKNSAIKAEQAMELDIGCTDILNLEQNPLINSCRINSLIKYKKLYEAFAEKLKKSLYQSVIDSTTEVYNRSFFGDYIKRKEHKKTNSAVIMIDIDKFKQINDEFGHAFADSILKCVSTIIKGCIRSSDIVARYGGDEFIIMMNNVTKSVTKEIAHRIQKRVKNSTFHDIKCTVSVGVCCIESDNNISISEAISVADKFMYIAKQSGGDSVKICM
ncbi:MAG: GGDEF domain-containing protein [Holosporaceae bacterium]|jgi:diguanylate cyclase (GGDEF)-like protein|nr:GGDEF domain-containing protein [Holosporaceae bacterium]